MIHGATNMPLQEALEQYAKESYDIRAIIDQVPRTLSEKDKDELEKRLLDFPKRASYFIRMFKEGRDLTERGITLLNRGQAEGKEFSDLQKRLGEIDASVSNELEFVLICNRASDVDRKIARELTVKEEQDETPVDIMQSMHELYEAFLEGIVVFVILYFWRKRARFIGEIGILYGVLYALMRFVAEFFREPDAQLGFIAFGWLTQGQLVSLLIGGFCYVLWLYKGAQNKANNG